MSQVKLFEILKRLENEKSEKIIKSIDDKIKLQLKEVNLLIKVNEKEINSNYKEKI